MNMKQHLFSTVFALSFAAATSMAQRYDITLGNILFSQNGDNLEVTQNDHTDTYVFNNGTFSNILIYGNSTVTENIILVNTPWTSSGYETLITLSNVLIQSSANAPISLIYQSSVRLFLAAGTSNELTSTAAGYPGIKASDDNGIAKLRILGSGTLVANGGESSAGIGGDFYGACGDITIEGQATVIATGGMGGAGIGGGEANTYLEYTTGGGGLITITSNATVVAIGGNGGQNSFGDTLGGAAGIGGGGPSTYSEYIGGAGGTLTFSGTARVTALAGELASAIGGGEAALFGGTLSIDPTTKVVAFSDGTRDAIDDDDAVVTGNGYVMQLDYYNPKTAGTTNTVLRSGSVVTNIVATVDYQSIALSLTAANTYRVRCNNIPQESLGDTKFAVLQTGLKVFTSVADTNSLLFTTSTPVEVPYEWLAEYYPSTPENEYEELANSDGANSFAVWESYVAGLVPTNAASTFTASITFTNQTPYIAWSPNYPDRVYTVRGKGQLTDSSWGPTNSASRFFNVNVEKP